MAGKLKFKPIISRVKLNPEQAVLACDCYGWSGGVWGAVSSRGGSNATYCDAPGTKSGGSRTTRRVNTSCGSGGTGYLRASSAGTTS